MMTSTREKKQVSTFDFRFHFLVDFLSFLCIIDIDTCVRLSQRMRSDDIEAGHGIVVELCSSLLILRLQARYVQS